MRQTEKIEEWVVYQTIQGEQTGRRSVCKQSEWEAIELRYPGLNSLVQSGITTETEAEKLARGTSGDIVPRKRKFTRDK